MVPFAGLTEEVSMHMIALTKAVLTAAVVGIIVYQIFK